jgi:hypothetical protein
MAQASGWRECFKCLGLFSMDNLGPCAAGGQHYWGDPQQVVHYTLGTAQNHKNWETGNWFYCRRCSLLFFNAPHGQGLTWCPAGGGHDHFESIEYFLDHELYPSYDDRPFHRNWFRCDRCSALSHSPDEYAWHGWCPAGGAHRNVEPAYNLWETQRGPQGQNPQPE